MSFEFENYIYSDMFKIPFKENFTNLLDLRVVKAEKLNNGLTNVIYKINIDLIYPDSSEQKTIIMKFYLSQDSNQRI